MSKTTKIYMAGVGGMLGEAFYEVFNGDYILKCTDKDVNSSWLSFCDFRDSTAYIKDVKDFAPDFLFHIGAHTSLEYCEDNIADAYLTNTISVETAVAIANDLNIPILYISTAGIFDGRKEHYDDWDTPNPLGVYARSKYLGEKFVKENANKYYICRAGWMMGGGPNKDKKFVNKIVKQISAGANELNIVDDKLGTPTYTVDFASNVKYLIENNLYGLYNMVCQGATSRIEVAEEILKIFGRTNIKINKVDSLFFKKTYFAPRPDNERLINFRLEILKANRMRNWKTALAEYLNKYYYSYFS